MLQRILVAAGVLALLAGCSGEEETVEVEEIVEAVVVEEPAAEAEPPKRRLSGVERKRHRDAQLEFAKGFNLLYGRGGYHDPELAHAHLLKAAELGHPRSQGLVGVSYQKGRGVAKNREEAVRWLLIAAENGWPHAQLKIGEAYRDGYGPLEKDPVEAMKWLALAGQGGSIAASMISNSYAASLPSAQRQEGLQRARDWRIEHGLPVKKKRDANPLQPVVETKPTGGGRPAAAPSAPLEPPAAAQSAPVVPPAAEPEQPDPAPPAAGA